MEEQRFDTVANGMFDTVVVKMAGGRKSRWITFDVVAVVDGYVVDVVRVVVVVYAVIDADVVDVVD